MIFLLMTVVNEVGLGDPSFGKYIENHEDTPKMAALYALIRVLEIDPREIFYPDQDCNTPTVEQLSLLIAQCSGQEAQLLLSAVRAILSAVRNRDDLLVGTIT